MREFNDVSGPFTRMREDGYFPFVQAQYLLCQSHADAVAGCHIFVFAAVEELEQVLFVLVRHAHTVVRKWGLSLSDIPTPLSEKRIIELVCQKEIWIKEVWFREYLQLFSMRFTNAVVSR